MKFKYIKSTLFLGVLAGAFATTGCKKSFLEVNQNPNSITESNVTAELIFPSAAARTGARNASGNQSFLNNWLGYWSTPGDFSINQEETSYNISFSFAETFWQTHYDVLFDLDQTTKRAVATGDTVLAGASMILSVKLWQELVDLYGNIPYSKAFNLAQTSTPAYDKAEDVYKSLHATLDKATSYMKGTARSTYATVVGLNVKIGGAAATQPLWIKYANTLKLRLLLRASEVTLAGIDRTAELAKITANGGVLGAGQTVATNPGYVNEVGKQSPYYGNFAFTPTGTDANTSTRANKYAVDSLSARGDARLTRFYRGAGSTATTQGGAVVGTRYGQSVPANPGGAASSKIGSGLAASATQDQFVFTSVESLFLLAEAVQRGWLPGTPATAYQDAVTESFVWLGVTNPTVAATTYTSTVTLANFANASIVLPSGFVFTPVKFIAYQKYIALNGIDPIEAYSDLRRLDMIPDKGYLSVNPSRHAGNKLPNRVLYPQEEYTLNFANVSAQGDINKDNIFTTAKIFWQP